MVFGALNGKLSSLKVAVTPLGDVSRGADRVAPNVRAAVKAALIPVMRLRIQAAVPWKRKVAFP